MYSDSHVDIFKLAYKTSFKLSFRHEKNAFIQGPIWKISASWWFQPRFNPFEKYACQIGSFSQVGMKIKSLWNQHLVWDSFSSFVGEPIRWRILQLHQLRASQGLVSFCAPVAGLMRIFQPATMWVVRHFTENLWVIHLGGCYHTRIFLHV